MPASTAETSISAPFAGVVAMVDRHQQGRRVVEGGLVVHVRQPPARGLSPGQAADVRDAADRLHHRPVAAEIGMRAGVAEPAHPRVDHVRGEGFQVLVGQAPALHHARGEVLGDDTGRGDQPVGQFAPLGAAHVDGHAELVAAVVVEQAALVRIGVGVLVAVGARLALVDRQAARHVEPLAVLDPDHLGAEVGQQPGRAGADAHPAEIGDADARQRPLPRSRHAGRLWPAPAGRRGAKRLGRALESGFAQASALPNPCWRRLATGRSRPREPV